ncbi:B3 domain-containing transcription factor VRN1-like [Herrania umbratica]|uniref:B3 domain-containing transcription factor VRN1-like n=1 Tax=Herrania umbratica TaxID=108875 RepID=A0A6J0ZJ56_9ROSI|nr:B3 domain-containing transcription factor VRN1-like [Herrania umbratica]
MTSSHRKGNDHSTFTSESPHFFKIILPETLRDGKLGIPTKFVKKYGNAMSSPALLKVPNGEIWKVELTKADGKVWLKNGWQEFLNHYSLEYGHFLVFRYEGNCNFHVIIFDRSASEIEYPYTSNNHGQHKELPEEKIEESEDDDSIQILEVIAPSRKTREKSHLPYIESNLKSESLFPQFRHDGSPARKGDKSTRSRHRIQKLKADNKAEALQSARAFNSVNPFFLLVMQPSYVGFNPTCRLAIPNNFVRKHLMKEDCEVNLCNSNGKTWTVSFHRREKGRKLNASLQIGWRTFANDNNIQVGDVCVFELINCSEISFKVSIYQGKTDVFHRVKKNAGESSTGQDYQKPLNAFEKAKAIQIASAFRSENPSFAVVLQPSYVHKLSVPEKFARKFFSKKLKEVILRLSNGKSWPVKYYQHSIRKLSAKLCNGWRKFVLDNKLEVGDICVFELTEGIETSFKVTIYGKQAIEDANLGSSLADKSTENQVESKESLVINVDSDSVHDKGNMNQEAQNLTFQRAATFIVSQVLPGLKLTSDEVKNGSSSKFEEMV